jgi:hypothetical protein
MQVLMFLFLCGICRGNWKCLGCGEFGGVLLVSVGIFELVEFGYLCVDECAIRVFGNLWYLLL